MRFKELISMAFANLWRRKLRTALTILAVVIGATLVALMVSIGSGLQGFIINQFGMVVSRESIIVSPNPELDPLQFQQAGPREIHNTEEVVTLPFDASDIAAIRSIPGVERIDYNISISPIFIQPSGSDKMYSVEVDVVPEYSARLRPLVAGRYFSDESAGQIILPFDYVQTFGWSSPEEALGKQVTMQMRRGSAAKTETRDYAFIVVGVIDKTASRSPVLVSISDGADMGRFQRNNTKLYSEDQPGSLLVVKTDRARVNEVSNSLKDAGFGVVTANQILARINSVFNIIQIGLGAFGGIALVVAAIGIVNTLMMAIYERTREIGVLKAVGATRGTIRALFTAEGGALGFLGGVIGVLIAFILGQLLNFVGARTFLSEYPGFNMSSFSIGLMAGVVLLTTLISLAAGLYPAARAARLDPVEALRYE
jgi:putative ABC transport system permease protein